MTSFLLEPNRLGLTAGPQSATQLRAYIAHVLARGDRLIQNLYDGRTSLRGATCTRHTMRVLTYPIAALAHLRALQDQAADLDADFAAPQSLWARVLEQELALDEVARLAYEPPQWLKPPQLADLLADMYASDTQDASGAPAASGASGVVYDNQGTDRDQGATTPDQDGCHAWAWRDPRAPRRYLSLDATRALLRLTLLHGYNVGMLATCLSTCDADGWPRERRQTQLAPHLNARGSDFPPPYPPALAELVAFCRKLLAPIVAQVTQITHAHANAWARSRRRGSMHPGGYGGHGGNCNAWWRWPRRSGAHPQPRLALFEVEDRLSVHVHLHYVPWGMELQCSYMVDGRAMRTPQDAVDALLADALPRIPQSPVTGSDKPPSGDDKLPSGDDKSPSCLRMRAVDVAEMIDMVGG